MEDYENHWHETRSPKGLSVAVIIVVFIICISLLCTLAW